MKLDLVPLAADPIPIGNEAQATVWAARTNDPIFIARPADGSRFAAGWYSARIELRAREGRIADPQLYVPDVTGRYAEARSVRLAGTGPVFSAQFHVSRDVDHLRLDPSCEPCVFTCGLLRVEPARRAESLLKGWLSAAERATAAFTRREPDLTPEMRRHWEERGYLVLPGFYSDAELDAAERVLHRAWKENEPRIVVDDLTTNQRMLLMEVSEEARRDHRFKVNDLFLEHQEIRRLALNSRLTPIVRELLGQVPVICNSLNFQLGSSQPDHVDALYMTPQTPGQLVASWVALEDCHPDSGPLRYFPGSHKIPPYIFSNGGYTSIPKEMDQWRAYMAEHVEKMGLAPEVFLARRGDVFIWSAYLLHGGSHIVDPARTRRSIVFHYLSVDDVLAINFRVKPFEGGFWLDRPHAPIPNPKGPPPLTY
jgi:phytanoyl-CoA hydroxylase